MMRFLCMYCGTPVLFYDSTWRHADGGGSYAVECGICGFYTTERGVGDTCPKCGSKCLRDHHHALPNMERESPCTPDFTRGGKSI